MKHQLVNNASIPTRRPRPPCTTGTLPSMWKKIIDKYVVSPWCVFREKCHWKDLEKSPLRKKQPTPKCVPVSFSATTHLVTWYDPVHSEPDNRLVVGHRAVVTAPGQIAHEFIDTGANAQPGTGRYTRSHSTGLDVCNNIGDTRLNDLLVGPTHGHWTAGDCNRRS